MVAIDVQNLVKQYNGVRAVDGVSFRVESGEIFGLLGPNGAGKTTTVEILEGLRTADSGRAEVLGFDVALGSVQLRTRIGVALQTATLMPNLTPRELLDLFASFYPRAVPAGGLLERLGLAEKATSPVEKLSGGQQQRLSVALALVNDPELIFLDEPTAGLDPQARRGVWDLVEEKRQAGKTVLLTTHYMEEAEHLCNRVAIMDGGRILALDTPERLVRAEFPDWTIHFAAAAGMGTQDYAGLPGVQRVTDDGREMVVYSQQVQETLSALLQGRFGLNLDDLHVRRATLEDVFLKLTGRRIRE